jgi:hypothetical protein
MTEPHGPIRLNCDGQTGVAFLAAKLGALRANGFLVAVAVLSKADAR